MKIIETNFVVSYQNVPGGLCGNQAFLSVEALDKFIEENKAHWHSFSRWQVLPQVGHSITRDLKPL